MSLAERTRAAARDNPFIVDALRADVVNYSAAARHLDVDGDVEAVATALRRYADDLPPLAADARDVRVTMERGVGRRSEGDDTDALLAVSGTAFEAAEGDETAVLASGDVDLHATRAVLDALAVADCRVHAVAYAEDVLVLVVPSLDAANALRAVEDALDAVPSALASAERR